MPRPADVPRSRPPRRSSKPRCYRGRDGVGIHLLGPLASKVLRISPPLTMTMTEAEQSLQLLEELVASLA
ncbi:MAG: hypothetical protein R3B90_12435 [Planctomycetaceae bacterium]